MKKKLSTLVAAAVLLASGCSGGAQAQTSAAPETTTAATSAPASETEQTTAAAESTDSEEPSGSIAQKIVSSLSMSVSGTDGKMTITRAPKKSSSMGDTDTWTVFVYLCGTDLESNGKAFASSDIWQLAQSESSDKVKFIVQTGGTNDWANEAFSSERSERYLFQGENIELLDSTALTSMGDPSTLADFLNWGVENYPAEKMGVIFWDHGGGSITGACFDERNSDDSLSLSELNTAFSQVYANMSDKFEFIGFDCCLMGTAETANILATYARYFYGSQECEPGTGWDYTTCGTFLAQNPGANGAQFGKVVTDSFYAECAEASRENECTFTVIDLDKFDEFTTAFNDYAHELYNSSKDDLAGIVRGVNNADNFGGNNKSEGYTNMVDIGGIINNCSAYADGSAALAALNDCIVYNKNGSDHPNASGLSVYYPLQLQGSDELGIFSGICISPYYLSLVDMVAKGYSDNGYTNEVFFTEDGDWTCDDCEYEYFDDSYFDDYTEGGQESSLITFEAEPMLTDEGNFGFVLDENGLSYTSNVRAYIYLLDDDGTSYELGETFDIIADWENGVFVDNFDGYWLALPNGQLLPTFVADIMDDYVLYTSPIYLNGKRTNLRIRQGTDGTVIEGAWDGIGENGVASREIKEITAGDKIAPIYNLGEENEIVSSEYEWEDGDSLVYAFMPAAEYNYGFEIDDIYGDYYFSGVVSFFIKDDGTITFNPISE